MAQVKFINTEKQATFTKPVFFFIFQSNKKYSINPVITRLYKEKSNSMAHRSNSMAQVEKKSQ